MSKRGSAPWYLQKAMLHNFHFLLTEVEERLYTCHKGLELPNYVIIKTDPVTDQIDVNWLAPDNPKWVHSSVIKPTNKLSTYFKSRPQFYHEISHKPYIITPGIGKTMKWIRDNTEYGSTQRDKIKENLLLVINSIESRDDDS